MQFETSEEIQAAMDHSLRFALEVVMFAKVHHERGERVPDLGASVAAVLQGAMRTMNGFVELGYRPSDTVLRKLRRTCGTMLGETRGWNAIASSRTRDATARADLDPTIPSTKMLHTKKQRFWREYRAAVSEYHRLTNYLIAARRVLTGPERALLVEFADLAKRKSARLRRVVSLQRLDQIRD